MNGCAAAVAPRVSVQTEFMSRQQVTMPCRIYSFLVKRCSVRRSVTATFTHQRLLQVVKYQFTALTNQLVGWRDKVAKASSCVEVQEERNS